MFLAGVMAIQSELKKQLINRFFDRVRFDEPMSVHTTFRVGGPADAAAGAAPQRVRHRQPLRV